MSVIPNHFSVFASPTSSSGPTWYTVNFSAVAVSGSWNYTSWVWTLGDGNISRLQNPSHTYTVPGNYQANVTVTDSSGSKASSATIWINVTHSLPFSTTLTPSSNSTRVGHPVWINATMTGGVAPFSFKWNATAAYAGCVTSATSSIATCNPTLPGKTFSLGVEVTDLYGAT
ncbi:MAG: PKD domain-containing protein, partial [Nitrososphaerota archaeon]|nr:PKD domain-containing protein [Nitrososphaerota archaeon]